MFIFSSEKKWFNLLLSPICSLVFIVKNTDLEGFTFQRIPKQICFWNHGKVLSITLITALSKKLIFSQKMDKHAEKIYLLLLKLNSDYICSSFVGKKWFKVLFVVWVLSWKNTDLDGILFIEISKLDLFLEFSKTTRHFGKSSLLLEKVIFFTVYLVFDSEK